MSDSISYKERGSLPDLVPTSTSSTSHSESHKGGGLFVRVCVIGFADGLTVPFALTAGLSSLGSSKLVIIGGLAELFAGAISMGLGAYLAASTEQKHYDNEIARERREIVERPEDEEEECYEIFAKYGLSREVCKPVIAGLRANDEMWIQFMMDFELKLERPSTGTACLEGVVMGISYFLGGLLPMIPYFAIRDVTKALFISIGISAFILLAFGYGKAVITGTAQKGALLSAVQTLIVGAAAAGASYGIVRGIDASNIS